MIALEKQSTEKPGRSAGISVTDPRPQEEPTPRCPTRLTNALLKESKVE